MLIVRGHLSGPLSHVADSIFVLDGDNTNNVRGPLGPHDGSVANVGAHLQEIGTGSLTPFAFGRPFLLRHLEPNIRKSIEELRCSSARAPRFAVL
jgi:hypothetical protein